MLTWSKRLLSAVNTASALDHETTLQCNVHKNWRGCVPAFLMIAVMNPSHGQLPKKIRKRLGDIRRRLRTRPARTRKQKEQLLAEPSLRAEQRQLLEKTESLIS